VRLAYLSAARCHLVLAPARLAYEWRFPVPMP